MLTYPWKCTVLHCNHLGNTWKPLVLMTRHFDYCPSASEGDNQSVRSSITYLNKQKNIMEGPSSSSFHSSANFRDNNVKQTANKKWDMLVFSLSTKCLFCQVHVYIISLIKNSYNIRRAFITHNFCQHWAIYSYRVTISCENDSKFIHASTTYYQTLKSYIKVQLLVRFTGNSYHTYCVSKNPAPLWKSV